ncbi:hypothetical protein AVEN_93234-1 [Araneus ventricosus]|uniref:Uncharacterized protein n=1 Tax=Araneus ventricosus TaxID=182803 RepID=A0A4Y2TC95_ARAVE|nr:hypothetical protein AVEN_93234-1 [Araneus ventricosus]
MESPSVVAGHSDARVTEDPNTSPCKTLFNHKTCTAGKRLSMTVTIDGTICAPIEALVRPYVILKCTDNSPEPSINPFILTG